MAVTFDAVGPSSSGSYSAPVSWTHTPVGTPTVVFVQVAVGADGATCSVTYGGTSMVSLGKVHSGGLTAGFEQLFALAGPAAGAQTVTVTLTSGTGSTVSASSLSYKGSGTTAGTAYGTPVTASSPSSATSGSISLTGASTSNMVVAGVCTGSGGETASGGDTRRSVTDVDSSTAAGCSASFDKASASGTVTINWTMASDAWGAVAVEILAAGGSTSVSSSDSGTGSDTQTASSPFKNDSDSGTGSERWATNATKSSSDSGTGLDTQSGFSAYITGVAGGANGYFVDQFGTPRLVWGDAAWALPGNVGRWSSGAWQADYDTYLAARQGQGLTVIYTKPMGTTQSGNIDDQGGTFDSLYPFQGGNSSTGTSGANPSSGLTEAYWARIDYLLNSAKAKGLTIIMNAIGYSSDFFSGPGPLAGKSQSEFQSYGTALGARYANQPNLIWTLADDYFGGDDDVITSFLTGLRNAGDTHVVTIENNPETTSRLSLDGNNTHQVWGFTHAQYNFVYSYQVIYVGVELAYTADGTLPVIAGDGYFYQGGSSYQGGTSFAFDRNFRQEAWWALSSGARGKVHGDEAVWQFQSTALSAVANNWWWKNNSKNIRTTVEALAGWQNLIPDTSSQLVTAGRGTHAAITATQYESSTSDSYVTASKTPDGTLALIYLSHGSTITIDPTKMAGPFYARRIDPVTGQPTLFGQATSYNSTSWGNNSQGDPDWALALMIDPADNGTGSEGTPSIGVFSSDSGSGSEFASFTPPTAKSSSDSGTGADGGEQVTATIPASDTGTGADALKSLTASTSDSDAGTGADAGVVGVITFTPADSDTGTGAEAAATSASVTSADTGTGADAGMPSSGMPQDSDAGTGADALKSLVASLRSADAGTGTDAGAFLPAGSVPKADSDSGQGQENDRHAVADTDAGSGAEATPYVPGIVAHDDEATGTEGQSVFIVFGVPSDSDSGSGAEAWRTSGPKLDSDQATGDDEVAAFPPVRQSDAGSGTDAQSPIAVFPFPLPWEFGPGGGLRLRPGGRVALVWHEGQPDELVVREWEQFHPSQAEYARTIIGSLSVAMVAGSDAAQGGEASLPTATIHQYATAPAISCSVPTA